jgi:hypothetical protein
MTLHIVAHRINGQGVTDVEPAAIQDDVLTISVGSRFYVPAEYNYVHYVFARGSLLTSVRLSTPSIEAKRLRYYIFPIEKRSLVNDALIPIFAKYSPPLELVPTEELRYLVSLASSGSAADHVILTLLGPREPRRGQPGDLRIARGTFSVNVGTAWTWTSAPITLDVPLEAGQYNLWGAVVNASNLVAARLILYGQVWRPPAIALASGDIISTTYARVLFDEFVGYLYGTFDHMHVPQIQILTTSTGSISGQVYLLVEKTR